MAALSPMANIILPALAFYIFVAVAFLITAQNRKPTPIERSRKVRPDRICRSTEIDPDRLSIILDLPAELRNTIYTYALTRSRPLSITSYGARACINNTRVLTSLLTTCRQIYTEANPILYGFNTFHFKAPLALGQFLRTIDVNVVHLRSLHVSFSQMLGARDPFASTWTFVDLKLALKQAATLEKLVFWIPQTFGKDRAKQLAEELRKVYERRQQVVSVEVKDGDGDGRANIKL